MTNQPTKKMKVEEERKAVKIMRFFVFDSLSFFVSLSLKRRS